MSSFLKVYELVKKIPKGNVSTYGEIAKLANLNPKVVGYALHANKNGDIVPCHRVINYKGKLSNGFAFGGPKLQRKILENEGIRFNKEEIVDLNKFGYKFN